MAIISLIGAVAASGARLTNVKPTATWNSAGVFNITNADATANYSSYSSVTAGTLTFAPGNSTVSLSNANSIGTIANRTAKGVTTSPSVAVERKSFQYAAYYAPAPQQYPFPHFQGCPSGGTIHSGQCMVFYGSPTTYLVPAPGYNPAPTEWYKIT